MLFEQIMYILAVIIIVAIIVANFTMDRLENKCFNKTYNMISGTIWGVAILVLAGLLILPIRDMENYIIHSFFELEFVSFFLEKYEFLYKLSLPEFVTAAF